MAQTFDFATWPVRKQIAPQAPQGFGGRVPAADQILSCITMVVTRLQARQVSTSVLSSLPLFMRSPVVQGMRRGGKELGVPTGNTKLSTLVYTLAVYLSSSTRS